MTVFFILSVSYTALLVRSNERYVKSAERVNYLYRLKGYVVKHNYVNEGVFNGYIRQLHVSVFTGHLLVVFKRT